MLINSSANPTGDITMPTVQGALEHLRDLSVSSHTGNFEDIRISQDAVLLAVVVLYHLLVCGVTKKYVPWELLPEIAPHSLGPPEQSA